MWIRYALWALLTFEIASANDSAEQGIGARADHDYCQPSQRCSEGQGDCDTDNDCASGLLCGQDNCRDLHPNAHHTHDCCVRKIDLCRDLSGYANSWDGKLDFWAGQYGTYSVSNKMITGFYSTHNNRREDRRWKFYTGSASDATCRVSGTKNWANNWDGHLFFQCPTPEVLYGVYSEHDNGTEDRRWKFKCCNVGSFATLRYGGWTSYMNNWDADLDYRCSKPNEVIVGVKSDHDNHREDRRWKFRCAELLKRY